MYTEYEVYYMGRLERFAFFFGAAAIPSTLLSPILLPCLLGSMAIVFAVLSKGRSLRFSKRARRGAVLGGAAIVINMVYLVFALKTLRELLADPSGRQQISDLLYRQYGLTLDELLPQLERLPFIR